MPLHTTQPHKNIKVAWGGRARRGGVPIRIVRYEVIHYTKAKKVNLSTEVVKGMVPKGVSKWYMVRVVPKVVPKCGIEGGIEIHIPIIINI